MADTDTGTRKVKLVCGANIQEVEVPEGETLSKVRETYKDVLNIPPEAEARLGATEVEDDHVLEDGQQIEWVKAAGVKG